MKPRKPDPLPKIRIQIGEDDLKKLAAGSRRNSLAPADKNLQDLKPRPRPLNESN